MAGLMPSSGAIGFSTLQSVYDGGQPVYFSQYYYGGARVSAVSSNNGIPSSGQLAMSYYYGKGNATLVLSPSSINSQQFQPEPAPQTRSMSGTCTASGVNLSSGSWSYVSGSTFNLSAPNSLSTNFQWTMNKNTDRSGVYRFTGNNGLSATLSIYFYYYTDL